MDLNELTQKLSDALLPKYWYFVAEKDGDCCEKCRRFDGKVFSDEDPAKPELPIHPNCRCSWRKATIKESAQAMEILTPKAPSFAGKNLADVVQQIKNIYDLKIPKPPRETNNKANWAYMTWMWFFEQGKNKIRFSSNSLESQDIANSYSMKELKKEYFKTGKIPKLWQFTGPGTATGNYGEVEWFLGSYTIKDFKLENGIATFTVYNKSGWRSGTRLPKSWSDKIKKMTGFEISELVTDAPRGEVIKTKIEKYFPEASKIPGSGYILKLLPSYGGDWEQYYEIRMEWKK
jgi:hypothetical protein